MSGLKRQLVLLRRQKRLLEKERTLKGEIVREEKFLKSNGVGWKSEFSKSARGTKKWFRM